VGRFAFRRLRKEEKKKEMAESGEPKKKKKAKSKAKAAAAEEEAVDACKSAAQSDYGVSDQHKGGGGGGGGVERSAARAHEPCVAPDVAPSLVAYSREQTGGYQVRGMVISLSCVNVWVLALK
jgi:hypothetical protein